MRFVLSLLVLLHGSVHLIGFAKAFGLAELSALQHPISHPMGLAWLTAAVLLAAAAAALAWPSRTFWMFGIAGVVASQLVIVSSWADARWGTLANLFTLALVVWAFISEGPLSLHTEYRRSVEQVLARSNAGPVLEVADVASLPAPVRRYLEVSGAMGRPRVNALRARWRGRIRGGPDEPWMQLSAEQVNTLSPANRLFWMDASLMGVAIPGLHAYRGDQATMRVRVLGLVPVADGRGPEMTRAETVTLFNDMSMLAPSMLTSEAIRWEELAPDRARGHFANAGHTVSAELIFGEDGMLADFVSDDRTRSSDGKAFERARWSTPLSETKSYGALRLASRGEARWHQKDGTSYAYIELELLEIEHDPRA